MNPSVLLTTSSWVSHQIQSAHWLSCSSARSNVNSIHQCLEKMPLHQISQWPISSDGKFAWWTQLFPVTMLADSHRYIQKHTQANTQKRLMPTCVHHWPVIYQQLYTTHPILLFSFFNSFICLYTWPHTLFFCSMFYLSNSQFLSFPHTMLSNADIWTIAQMFRRNKWLFHSWMYKKQWFFLLHHSQEEAAICPDKQIYIDQFQHFIVQGQ